MVQSKQESPATDLADAWGAATRRVWPALAATIAIVAEGLTIFFALSFLSILDRSLLFAATAFATLFVISVLASEELATKLDDVRGRLSAVAREKDKSDEMAKRVPELEAKNADLPRTVVLSTTDL